MSPLLFRAAVSAAVVSVVTQLVPADATHLRLTRVGGPIGDERASTGGVSWVDADGDGRVDLFVANGYDVSQPAPVAQASVLYLNRGRGTFAPIDTTLTAVPGLSSGSAWADIDNDGDVDVFVPRQAGRPNALFFNRLERGRLDFELATDAVLPPDTARSFAATFGDADGDGFVDLYVSNGGLSAAEPNMLYRNDGGRRFVPVTGVPPVLAQGRDGGASWIDVDDDGDLDLSVANDGLYRNDGAWRFARVGPEVFNARPPFVLGAVGGAWGDMDNDGDLDLFVPYQLGESGRLYRNDDGRLTEVFDSAAVRDGLYGTHALWADLDNNGWLDLIVATWASPSAIYMNDGKGLTRADTGEFGGTPTFASSAAAADYDEDGDLDLIVGNWPNQRGEHEANHLWRNDTPAGHWIQLTLTGTQSNRSAIGARVSVTVMQDGRPVTMRRDVRSQDGWRSQSPFTLHFGLGRANEVDVLTIRWPSGLVEQYRNLAAGQRLTLEEGRAR